MVNRWVNTVASDVIGRAACDASGWIGDAAIQRDLPSCVDPGGETGYDLIRLRTLSPNADTVEASGIGRKRIGKSLGIAFRTFSDFSFPFHFSLPQRVASFTQAV